MVKYFVFKTVVSHPDKVQFVLQFEKDQYRLRSFASLAELAATMREAAPNSLPSQESRAIRNEIPGDIIWYPNTGDKVAGDDVMELVRLSRNEVHELARMLRK